MTQDILNFFRSGSAFMRSPESTSATAPSRVGCILTRIIHEGRRRNRRAVGVGPSRSWGCGAGQGMTGRVFHGWGSGMGWVLRLVESGVGDAPHSVDVLEIDRPRDLGDLANLGL